MMGPGRAEEIIVGGGFTAQSGVGNARRPTQGGS